MQLMWMFGTRCQMGHHLGWFLLKQRVLNQLASNTVRTSTWYLVGLVSNQSALLLQEQLAVEDSFCLCVHRLCNFLLGDSQR